MTKILITTPSISLHDAVSNDVWIEERFFKRLGLQVFIYAEHAPDEVKSRLVGVHEAELLIQNPDTIWIYHHSVFWHLGDRLFNMAVCRVFLRYHNITPPEFFERYGEKVSAYATRQGLSQTQRFIASAKIEKYVGASVFNCDELVSYGAPKNKCADVAPFHALTDFDSAKIDDTTKAMLEGDNFNVLFVGRVVPNKGHQHLINIINAYVDAYGPKVRLHILGNVTWAPKAFVKELKDLVAKHRLGNQVNILGGGSFDVLHTLYKLCDAFLVTSEHEGFCVPIIEAQYHKLPIVALDRTAVKETLGPNQLCFKELDYARFAAALHLIRTDSEVSNFLGDQGYVNQQRFSNSALEAKLRTILSL